MNPYVEEAADLLEESYRDRIGVNHDSGEDALPRREEVLKGLNTLLALIFPGFESGQVKTIKQLLYEVNANFSDLIERSFRHACPDRDDCAHCNVKEKTKVAVKALIQSLCELREIMKLDVAAAYSGDPAAKSYEEIIFSYPGIRAITIQRLAHVLYMCGTPLIPRLMTEYAHTVTGIDIHPGAVLGKGVFIDHGTGVVIGETARIGDNVRIYQGVTLGALSFPKDACGMLIKGCKRHPTVENDVVIYSGATILGDITIGEKCVVGGNVWLTEDLPPGTKIIANPPETKRKSSGRDKSCTKPCGKSCQKRTS